MKCVLFCNNKKRKDLCEKYLAMKHALGFELWYATERVISILSGMTKI